MCNIYYRTTATYLKFKDLKPAQYGYTDTLCLMCQEMALLHKRQQLSCLDFEAQQLDKDKKDCFDHISVFQSDDSPLE